jgi:hypothetical protein
MSNPLKDIQNAYGAAIRNRLQLQYRLDTESYPEYYEALKIEIAAKQALENLQ